MSASNDKSGDIMSIPGAEDTIDPATFEQILEMDDDQDEREFSKSIVYDFFGQAESTFKKMDNTLESQKDDYLKELSELGHFLKGSSATLGLTKVKDECEKIQNYGNLKDETGHKEITKEESVANLRKSITNAKRDFQEVEVILRRFYKDE